MKFSESFKGSFFKADDVKRGAVHGTVDAIEQQDIGDEPKVVIRFTDQEQSLVLNKSNGARLAEAWGDDMDKWIGKVIELSLGTTKFQGRDVGCIVCNPSSRKPVKSKRPF